MKKDAKKKRRFRQSFARFLQKAVGKPSKSGLYRGPVRSFVILAQEKYGDAILLTPLLKNLKTHFPESSLTVVTFTRTVYVFFQSDPHVDTVYYTKSRPFRYISSMMFHKPDILFNTKDHPSTNFLIQSMLVPARCKIGIENDYHTGIYDYLVKTDFHTPIALKNCGLLKLLGKTVDEADCRPYLPPMPVSEKVRSFIAEQELSCCIGLNISAGGATRYWTEENWQFLCDAFPKERFIVFSAPEDEKQKKQLEARCSNIIPSPATGNLYEASRIMEPLKLLVTPDTAMIHVASCVNTPIVGLYGKAPQDQTRFRPFLVDYLLEISPSAYVRDIPAETVVDDLREKIGQ